MMRKVMRNSFIIYRSASYYISTIIGFKKKIHTVVHDWTNSKKAMMWSNAWEGISIVDSNRPTTPPSIASFPWGNTCPWSSSLSISAQWVAATAAKQRMQALIVGNEEWVSYLNEPIRNGIIDDERARFINLYGNVEEVREFVCLASVRFDGCRYQVQNDVRILPLCFGKAYLPSVRI